MHCIQLVRLITTGILYTISRTDDIGVLYTISKTDDIGVLYTISKTDDHRDIVYY